MADERIPILIRQEIPVFVMDEKALAGAVEVHEKARLAAGGSVSNNRRHKAWPVLNLPGFDDGRSRALSLMLASMMRFAFPASVLLLLSACGEKTPPAVAAPVSAPKPPAAALPVGIAKPQEQAAKKTFWSAEMLHTEIKYHNPGYDGTGEFSMEGGQPIAISLRGAKITNLEFLTNLSPLALDLSGTPIKDIRPVKGMKLIEMYLEDSPVTDLSPLRGMPLEKLYLSRTPVSDLSALSGAPLVELNLVDTKVSDLSPLSKSPIQMLWLTGAPVVSIAPLKGVPMVSLTLHRTQVVDLSPLMGSYLQRLHIGETPVSDLSPLKGLSLTRLVFTPANIKAGLDTAKSLPLQEIGTKFDEESKDLMPPAAFWATH